MSLKRPLAARLEASEGLLRGIITTVRKGGMIVLMVTALMFAACASSASNTTTSKPRVPQMTTVTSSSVKTYRLLSDGWNGGVALTALHVGRFHAVRTSRGVCVWLGSTACLPLARWIPR